MTATVEGRPQQTLLPGTSGLRLRSLTAGYGEVVVLRDVSLAVPVGEVVAILGPNGAGKTTLLRSVLGTTRVRSGRIELDGEDIVGWPPDRLARAGLCYVPEGRAIYRTLQPGEREVLRAAREIRIRTGDAGALRWQIDGGPATAMGKAGEVRTARITSAEE